MKKYFTYGPHYPFSVALHEIVGE
jgi:hypothetical protein